MISSKSYKIFFLTLLVIGGFLVLGIPEKSEAAIEGLCCCNDGTTQSYAIGATNPCDTFCGTTGIQANVSYDPSVSTPTCPDTTAPAEEWVNCDCNGISVNVLPPETCETACDGTTGGEPAGATSSGQACGGAFDEPCPDGESCVADDPDVNVYEGHCFIGGDPTTGGGLPGGATTGGGAPRNAGPAVNFPNFSGLNSIQDLFARIIAFIMPLAMLFAGVMIIWSGFLFVTAQGEPAKITKARQNLVWTITGVAIILASSAIVDYISGLLGGASTGAGAALKTRIETILMTQIIPLLFILVTVYFFWGVITYVRAGGDQKAIDTGKQHMIWGIIGMAVMASAWGIVEIIGSMVR